MTKTSKPLKTNPPPILEDENARASASTAEDSTDSPEVTSLVTPAEFENPTSSSSEDRPILSRCEAAGTKRKAEVLSKESGKIGVTITTSSPSNSSPPPPKTSKLQSPKPSASPAQVNNRINGRRNSLSKSENEVPTSLPSVPAATPESKQTNADNKSTKVETPSTPVETAKDKETPKAVDESIPENECLLTRQPSTDSDQVTNNSNLNNSKNCLVNGHNSNNNNNSSHNNNNNNNGVISDATPVLTSPGSDYWLARNPVVDQVFITDVTVNLKTVTIRECKTEKGFFKERSSSDPKPSDIIGN